MRGQPGFFDIDDRLKRLSDLGDQLETFPSAGGFELFRPELNAAVSYNDRLSFMRFLGLGLEDRVPDARTIWLFREKLTTAGAIKRLSEQFDAMLRQSGYIAMSGQIAEPTAVAAPRQRT